MQNEDTAEHEVRLGKGFHSFTQLDNLIFTYYGRRMGVYGRLVYESLLYHANNTTHKCWPSHQTIAEEGGMSVRQVQRELANLVEMGFIQIISRIAEGKSNLYIVEALKDPFTEDGVTNSRTHKQTSEKPNRGGLIDMGGWTNSPTNYTNSTILINKFLSPKGDSVPPPPADTTTDNAKVTKQALKPKASLPSDSEGAVVTAASPKTLPEVPTELRYNIFDAGDGIVKNVPPPDKAPAKKPNSAPQAIVVAPKTDLQLQVDRVRSRVLSLNNKKRPANASDAWFTRMVEVYGFRDTMIAVSISEEREVIQVSFIEGVIKRLTPREKENYDDDGLLLPEPAQSNYSNNNSGYKDYNKSPTTLDFSKYTTGKYAYLLAKSVSNAAEYNEPYYACGEA